MLEMMRLPLLLLLLLVLLLLLLLLLWNLPADESSPSKYPPNGARVPGC